MTLTHIIPTLRRSIPDPLTHDRWPAHTVAGIADITISGLSLMRLVDWCDSPCVHTEAAVIPGSGGRASTTELASVVIMRVETAERTAAGQLSLTTDATLDRCRPIFAELRMIGRASAAPDEQVTLHASASDDADIHSVRLPSDVRVGDLLVVPCLGIAPRLGDVRTHACTVERKP